MTAISARFSTLRRVTGPVDFDGLQFSGTMFSCTWIGRRLIQREALERHRLARHGRQAVATRSPLPRK